MRPLVEIHHLVHLAEFGFLNRQRFRERAFGEQPWQARAALEQVDRERYPTPIINADASWICSSCREQVINGLLHTCAVLGEAGQD